MSTLANTHLETMDARYAQLLALGHNGQRLTTSLEQAQHCREEYARVRFVSIPDVLSPGSYSVFVDEVLPFLAPFAERLSMRHEVVQEGVLSDGFSFARLDPVLSGNSQNAKNLNETLRQLRLLEFATQLALKLTPLIRFVAGPVSFKRAYFYLYSEGDYISVHDDHHVGERVDVQFPISIGTRGGIRVLEDGFLRMHYDDCGSMNILGPSVWHDVPPILAMTSDAKPLRFNMGYRFTPDT